MPWKGWKYTDDIFNALPLFIIYDEMLFIEERIDFNPISGKQPCAENDMIKMSKMADNTLPSGTPLI